MIAPAHAAGALSASCQRAGVLFRSCGVDAAGLAARWRKRWVILPLPNQASRSTLVSATAGN
jgi:hypothetical protein